MSAPGLRASAIAAAAMLWVLPDWQGRRLAAVAARALAAHAHYLREIIEPPAHAAALGRRGAERAKRYTWAFAAARLRRLYVDVSALEPVVVVPPSPANTRDLADYAGLEVHMGYLGSCASGRLEDLRAAAAVLKGRRIKPGFQLHVVPTSQAIFSAAAAEGLISTLVDAGAFISGVLGRPPASRVARAVLAKRQG